MMPKNQKEINTMKCPNCTYLLTPIIHLDIPHVSYICHKCGQQYNKPERPQKIITEWI
jgi:DNA-directed RNA polymerase subunit RPC12/RpoP